MKRTDPPRLITAEQFRGPELLIALSRSRKDRAYVLTTDRDGRYVCPCFKFRRVLDCSHTQVASDYARERRAA